MVRMNYSMQNLHESWPHIKWHTLNTQQFTQVNTIRSFQLTFQIMKSNHWAVCNCSNT